MQVASKDNGVLEAFGFQFCQFCFWRRATETCDMMLRGTGMTKHANYMQLA